MKNSNPAEAVRQAEGAKSLHQDVLRIRPDSELALKYLMEDQLLLGQALIAAGRIPEAMSAAEEFPTLRPAEAPFYVHAIALLIQCAKASPETVDGRKQAEESLSRAVGIVRNAIRAKVFTRKATLDEKDFDPLRNREDFKALRDSLDDSVHIG